MKFLVELDHVKTCQPFTEDTERSFIESIIFPTLDKAEQLEPKITFNHPMLLDRC